MSQSASAPRSRETAVLLATGVVLAIAAGVAGQGGWLARLGRPAQDVINPAKPATGTAELLGKSAAPATQQAVVPSSVDPAGAEADRHLELATGSLPPASSQPSPLALVPSSLVQPTALQPALAMPEPVIKRVTTASITATPSSSTQAAPQPAAEPKPDAGPEWLSLAVPHDVPTLDGATFIIDTTTYRLAGITPTPADEICATKTGVPWACSSRARVALRLAIVDQTLRCRPDSTSVTDVTTVTCLKDGKPLKVGVVEP